MSNEIRMYDNDSCIGGEYVSEARYFVKPHECVCVFARSMQSRIVSEALHEQSNEPNSKSSSANIETKQEK